MRVGLGIAVAMVGLVTGCGEGVPDRPAALVVAMPRTIDVVVPGWVPDDLAPSEAAEVWWPVEAAVAQRFVDRDDSERQMVLVHEARPSSPFALAYPQNGTETVPRPEDMQWSADGPTSGTLSWTLNGDMAFAMVSGMTEEAARATATKLRLRDEPAPAGYDLARSSGLILNEQLRRPAGAAPMVTLRWTGPNDRWMSLTLVADAPEWSLLADGGSSTSRQFGELQASVIPGGLRWRVGPTTLASLTASGLTDAERDRVMESMSAPGSTVQPLAQAVSERLATQPLVAAGRFAELRRVSGDLDALTGATVELRQGLDQPAALCLVTADRRACVPAEVGSVKSGMPTADNTAASWQAVTVLDGQLVLIGTAPAGGEVVISTGDDQLDTKPALYEDGTGRLWLAAPLPEGITRALWQERRADGGGGASVRIPRLSLS